MGADLRQVYAWPEKINPEIIRLLLFRQNQTSKRESVEICISNKSSWNETVEQLSSDTHERAGRRDVATELVINDMVDLVHSR